MDISKIPSRFRRSLFLSLFAVFAVSIAGNLFAQPSIEETNFEDVFGLDDTLDGSLGGSSVVIEISYSSDVNIGTIGSGDLVCEGTGANTGKTIPVVYQFRYLNPEGFKTGQYKLGPLDPTGNGTYSLKIVSGQVTTGGAPEAVPEGEILAFTQNVNDPAPAILDVRFDPPLDGSGNWTEALGFERPKLVIDFNKDVAIGTISGGGFEIIGSGSASGKTIFADLVFPVIELEDKITAEFLLGPLNVADNGEYTVSLLENSIQAIGDNIIYMPGGEIASFNQAITNPPPKILTDIAGFTVVYFPTVFDPDGTTVRVYYNYVVDTTEIDAKDIRIVGISENNLGRELVVSSFPTSFAQNSPLNDAYVVANYNVVGVAIPGDPLNSEPLTEALNGDWEVQIVAGEVLDQETPPRALPAQVIGTFRQDIIDPFSVLVNGRIYEDNRDNPSLSDDGDPGLDIGARLEKFQGAGLTAAYQDVFLEQNPRNTTPTGLAAPISTATAGAAMSGSFTIPYDQSSRFQTGDTITVVGSSGNDRFYTISNTLSESPFETTILEVEEAVPSGTADGSITKLYTSNLSIDGVLFPLSVIGTEIPTLGDLVTRINTSIGSTGVSLINQGPAALRIMSASTGDSSMVSIEESDERTGLFSNLAGSFNIDTPVPGGDGFLPGYQEFVFNRTIFPTDSTELTFPIIGAAMGGASSGSFRLSGDYTSAFQTGVTFSVIDSTGNNGTYTVTSSEVEFFSTTINVAEAVPDSTADGSISKIYTAAINIDGTPIPLSFDPSEIPTFEIVLEKINEALGSAGTITLVEQQTFRVESASQGDESSVLISEPDPKNGLFSSLNRFNEFGNIQDPVPGSDWFTEGYHDVLFNSSAAEFEPSGLISFPVFSANSGAAMSGSFVIEGDQTQPIQWFDTESFPFKVGDTISVIDSTGNDGTYTVKAVSLTEGNTRIEVEEAVSSSVADGTITKVYTGEVIIDGMSIPLSIVGSDVPTYEDFIVELAAQIGDAGSVVFRGDQSYLRITSATEGPLSSVFVVITEARTDLFKNLLYGANEIPPVPGSDGWALGGLFGNGENEFFPLSEDDYGKFVFTINGPGEYRIRATSGQVWDPVTQLTEFIPPFPEWVVQALGDPNRDGAPKDHLMYFSVTEEMMGQTTTVNFSYVEENESPEAIEDDGEFDLAFQVPSNSVAYRLDVLKNDTVNGAPAGPGDLTIIGLSDYLAISEETTSAGSRAFSTITTDGDFVYYTPYSGFVGWELFYYTIEDEGGKRDFAPVYIFVTAGPIETQLFTLDDRFQVLPNSTDNLLAVLSNDFLAPSGSNSTLSITGLGTAPGSTATTAVGSQGGTITTTDNRNVIYTPVTDFEGSEIFYYDITDGDDKTGSASVVVSVIPDRTELNPVIGSYSNELGRMMSRTAQGRRLLELFERYAPEFYAILAGNPDIGGEVAAIASRLGLDYQALASGNRAGISPLEVGEGGEVLKTFDALKDGLTALVTGAGSDVSLTQEIIDQTVALRDMVYEKASDEMKADIDAELGDLEDKVGQNFDQFFQSYGVDSSNLAIFLFTPYLRESGFFVTVQNLEGIEYTLWKSTTLEPNDWVVVEDATISYSSTRAVIADPNPGGRAFYQLQRIVSASE